MDLYSRKVIGWSFSKRINRFLVCDALKMALSNRGYPDSVIMHTDRGSQYCSKACRKLLNYHGLRGSMSGKGCCYDNAVVESFFHSLKVQWVHRTNYETREQASRSIFWYIEAFYNRKRQHSYNNEMSPEQFERQHQSIAA